MMRRFALAVFVGTLAAGIAGAGAMPASAHAVLESSRPAANQTLGAPPRQLVLMFTEPPDPRLSSIRLLASSGAAIRLGPPNVSARTITVPIEPTLASGTYSVGWRVVSRTDGHVTAGSFAFGVGEPPSPAVAGSKQEPTSPFPSALSILGKWLLYAGLAVLLAAVAVVVLVLGIEHPRTWLPVAASAAALTGWVLVVIAESSTIGVSASAFLSSAAGRPFVWLGVATGVGTASAIAWSATSRRLMLWLAALSAASAMVVRSIGGHAAAGRLPALEVAAQFAHLLAVSIWIGGIVWLLLLVGRIEPVRRPDVVRRFSTTAGLALAVVAVTGAVRTLDELGGPTHLGRLFATDYGWTLVAKICASLALIAAGAWNRYVNVPRTANGPGGTRSLRRVLVAEAFLAAGIFGLTGLLTGLPPAVSAPTQGGASGPRPLVVTGSDFATTVRARLEISPGTVGTNHFAARVVDYDTGRAVDADRVGLRFFPVSNPLLPASTLPLHRASNGTWTATGSGISIDDRWELLLTVETPTGSTQVPMEVSPRVPTGRLTVTRAAGQPTLYTTTFADGASIQAYVDPGAPGSNQLHATAFAADGSELRVHSISLIAIPPDEPAIVLEAQPFSVGHYAANVTITPGSWRFEIRALSHTGGILDARFVQTFEGGSRSLPTDG